MATSLRNKGRNGPTTPEGRAKALLNLKPAKPGETRNPNGRPPAGLSVREWWNQMANWSIAEIESVMTDLTAPVCKVAAARAWIHASSKDLNSGGSPIAGPDLERIIDHTAGKAIQPLTVQGDVTFTLNIGNSIGSGEPSPN